MRAGLLTILAAFAAVAACGNDDDRPGSLPSNNGGTGGSAGTSGKGGSSKGGESNEGGSPDSGGAAGSGSIPEGCNDGVRAGDEECDGEDLGTQTCADLGFDSGTLSCAADCSLDTSDCVGTEQCADGLDNDGDDEADCADADCADACADPCADPPLLPDPASVTASTEERGGAVSSSCVSGDAEAPDAVYRFVAENTGTLEIELDAAFEGAVSVFSGCASASELWCEASFLSLAVTAGDELFVAVEGQSSSDAGSFTLNVLSRLNDVCADGYLDPGEECDDGNFDVGDGCDDACALESIETEPNGTFSDATAYTPPHVAEIAPEGDVDVVEVTVPSDVSSIVAEVLSLNEDCYRDRIDSLVTILDGDGTTELGSDDDSGAGRCSRATVSGLDAGTYFVSVAEFGDDATFPYELRVTVNRCGDSQQGPGEGCDDGDTMSGDGCSATCQQE